MVGPVGLQALLCFFLPKKCNEELCLSEWTGADLGGGCRGCAPPPTTLRWSFLFRIYVFASPSVTSFLRGAPTRKKNPGSAPDESLSLVQKNHDICLFFCLQNSCTWKCASESLWSVWTSVELRTFLEKRWVIQQGPEKDTYSPCDVTDRQ